METLDRDSLFADLRHGDEEIRRLAVERLSLLPEAEAVTPLVDCLGDPSWRVRKAAVERLIALEDVGAPVRALVTALADGENPGRRNAALEALTRFGAAAVPVLVDASHDADVDVRKQVVDALSAIGAPAAARRLAELLGDADPNVRAAAAEALGAIGGRESAPLLEARLDSDPEPLVQLSALRSLARLGVPVSVARLSAALADPVLRPSAHQLLGWSEDPGAFDALLKGLSAPARTAREAAMEALVRQLAAAAPGEEQALGARLRASTADASAFLPDALARLADAPLTTRLVLVQFLGWLGRPDCVVPLLEAANDEALSEVVIATLAGAGPAAETSIQSEWAKLSETARVRACALLGRTRGEVGETLLRRALAHGDPALCAVAATALAERGATSALPALVAALRNAAASEGEAESDGEVELEQAIRTLLEGADAAHGDRVAALLDAEMDGAPEGFRLASARLLGCIGGAAHRARLELLLSDPSAPVRRAAVESLARVAPQQLELLRCALADESPQVRIGAANALASSGDAAAVADLAGLLDDPEPRVVVAALRSLAAWAQAAGSDEARQRALLLLSVGLAHGGPSGLAALDALFAIGGEEAVDLARDALASADPEIAEAAVACIGAHGGRAALNDLLPALAHPAWNVRARVAQVIEERRHVHAIPTLIRQLDQERDDFVRGAILTALGTLESQ